MLLCSNGYRKLVVMLLMLGWPADAAWSRTLAALRADGYVAVRVLHVAGDYHGCRPRQGIALTEGGVFFCDTSSFRYLHRPDAVLLEAADGDRVLLLAGEELTGTFAGVPGLARRLRTGNGPQSEPVRSDFPDLPLTGALLQAEPIMPTRASIPPLDPLTPAFAPFHDDGEPRRYSDVDEGD